MRQRTSHIMMVRPASFGYNEQTAKSNAFQNSVDDLEVEEDEVQQLAIKEFDAYAAALKQYGVTVNIIQDSKEPKKPDAIFPNNWISFHKNGAAVLYPVYSKNRQWERRRSILDLIGKGYQLTNELDLSHYEEDDKFLEGTGSMIFDRERDIVYACKSIRTDEDTLKDFCKKLDCKMIFFDSVDQDGFPIYHTNVMMGLATDYVIICLESIRDETQRNLLLKTFKETNKELIDISYEQVQQFCGNVIELADDQGKSLLVMSDRAREGFTPAQKEIIERYSTIVSSPISTIEDIGGGGARCMVAEIFLPLL